MLIKFILYFFCLCRYLNQGFICLYIRRNTQMTHLLILKMNALIFFFYNGIFRKYSFYLPMITARKHKNNSFIIRRYHFGKGTGPLRTPKVCINQQPVALFIYYQNQCITLLVPVTHDQVHCESLSWIGYIQLKAYHIVKNN